MPGRIRPSAKAATRGSQMIRCSQIGGCQAISTARAVKPTRKPAICMMKVAAPSPVSTEARS
ncbi:hypothetical protein D3C81_2090850 [compost metagenome]